MEKQNFFPTYFSNYKINTKNIIYLQELLSRKENKTFMLIKGKKYIDKCLNGKFIQKLYRFTFKPLISSIIPVYNSEKTIYSSICSIQNQNFTDLEIILIDDCSHDNSTRIIEKLKEMDSRIKLF